MRYSGSKWFLHNDEGKIWQYDDLAVDDSVGLTIEVPVTESSNIVGWTKRYTVGFLFASGIEDVEEARSQVYDGSHLAAYSVPEDVWYFRQYVQNMVVDEGMDNTFEYEVLDQSEKRVLSELSD